MAKMMESLEPRQLFSVTLAESTEFPVDTAATTEEAVVVERTASSSTRLITTCAKGKHFPTATITT